MFTTLSLIYIWIVHSIAKPYHLSNIMREYRKGNKLLRFVCRILFFWNGRKKKLFLSMKNCAWPTSSFQPKPYTQIPMKLKVYCSIEFSPFSRVTLPASVSSMQRRGVVVRWELEPKVFFSLFSLLRVWKLPFTCKWT